jgi:hypothetical protein
MRVKELADGSVAYYWQPPNWAGADALRHGRKCPVRATALGKGLSTAIEKAEALNLALDGWRQGESRPLDARGTIAWLFGWYREKRLFTEKSEKTRHDYARYMELVANLSMRSGTLGTRLASAVDGEAADRIYEKLLPRGERTARYAIQVCRLVWSQAVRHASKTQVTQNPFLKMRLKSRPKKVNRATTRAEYDLYRATAHALGFDNFAAAAALSFELCQRVSTVFDYPTGDDVQRGIYWPDYTPGRLIRLRQNKTDTVLEIPLALREKDGSSVPLYPELEDELAMLERGPANIIVNPRTGQPYAERAVSTIHRKICDAAGLPKNMTFTGFRHGGLTEIGNAGEVDVRAISGHKQLSTTIIYNQVTREKARRIAEVRRRHIELLGETEGDY